MVPWTGAPRSALEVPPGELEERRAALERACQVLLGWQLLLRLPRGGPPPCNHDPRPEARGRHEIPRACLLGLLLLRLPRKRDAYGAVAEGLQDQEYGRRACGIDDDHREFDP